MSTREIDKHLATDTIHSRLCAISLPNHHWPALHFSSFSEFMTTLISDMPPSESLDKFKAQIASQYRKLKMKQKSDKITVAYLIGRQLHSCLVLLPEGSDLKCDFYVHYDVMDKDAEVAEALEVVMNRVDEVVSPDEGACEAKADYSLEEKKPEAVQSSKDVMSLHSSGYVPSGKKDVKKGVAKKKATKKKAKKSVEKEEEQTPVKGPPKEVISNEKEEAISPVSTMSAIHPTSDTKSKSSRRAQKAKPTQPPATQSSSPLTRNNLPKNEPWRIFFQALKDRGLSHHNGDNLVTYYWVLKEFAHLSKKDMKEQCVEGRDYFAGEEALKVYAKKVLGWTGEADSPMDTMSGDLCEGVKRRSRKVEASQSNKSVKKSGNAGKRKSKAKSPVESPSSGDDSNGYGFSQSGDVDDDYEEQELTGKKLTYDKKAEESECSSPSSSMDTSVDDIYTVMSSGDAWEILMKLFGFTYHTYQKEKYYCLPGEENKPGKNECAKKGVNYFSTIEELRKDLCAYGLPEAKKMLSDEQIVGLKYWVRYAHVYGHTDGRSWEIKPKYIEPLTGTESWQLLQKLGFKWSHGYTIPQSEKHEYKKFENRDEFDAHIARFGISSCSPLTKCPLDPQVRLALDLYFYDPDQKRIDTFKRIDPDSNELPSRRLRGSRASLTSTQPVQNKKNQATRKKKTQPSKFEKDFNELKLQRDIPSNIIGSQKAMDLLQKYYGVSFVTTLGSTCYSFIELHTNQKVEFSELQDMRENFCAYGLPPVVNGSAISKEEGSDVEFWVRSAHMTKPAELMELAIPENKMDYGEAKIIIEGLGYKMSKDKGLYVLPNASFGRPTLGVDGWNNLLGFFDHIARFGLPEPCEESLLSSDQILRFQVFVASVTTFDIGNRLQGDTSVKKPASTMQFGSTVQSFTLDEAEGTMSDEIEHNENDAGLLTQPPAMIETSPPYMSPPKKQKTNQPQSLLGWGFTKVKQGVEKLFTPTRPDKASNAYEDKEQPEELSPALSASCLEKGDDEVEACFADSASGFSEEEEEEQQLSSSRQSSPMISNTEAQAETGSTIESASDASPNHQPSPSKRKVEDISPDDVSGVGADAGNTSPRKNVQLSKAEHPTMKWAEMELQMKRDGVFYTSGTGLDSFFWFQPTYKGIKKNDLIEKIKKGELKEGEDYFTSKEGLQIYAKANLEWAGEVESELPEGPRRSRRESTEDKSPTKRAASQGPTSPPKKARKSPKAKAAKSVSSPKTHLENEEIVKDRLEMALMFLHPSSSGNYCVSQKTSAIMEFMSTAVESKAGNQTSSSKGFLYVCGRPGTGKTTVTSECVEDIRSWAEIEKHDKPRVKMVNMASLFASGFEKDGIKNAVLKNVAKTMGIQDDPSISALEKQAQKNVLILIIDEVDMLFKKRDGDAERFFHELATLTKTTHFRMIGISNSVSDEYAARIKEIGDPQVLVFSSYSEHELLDIVQKRTGKLIDTKALELVSRKVAATSGDARLVLEITSSAVNRCINTLSEDEKMRKIGTDEGPLVKIKHMMWAIREANVIKHAEVIQKLPQLAKVLLCIIVAYGHVKGPKAEISLSYLRNLCSVATKHALFEDTDVGTVINLCEMLCDQGLVRAANSGHFNPDDPEEKLIIDLQLDDVECALDESLLNGEHGSFYGKLMEFVKQRKLG